VSASKKPKGKPKAIDKFIEAVGAGKHSAALKMLNQVRRLLEMKKEVKVDFPRERKEQFLQVTVPERGDYLVWVVSRKGTSVRHRFYLKSAGTKRIRGKDYSVLSMRLPADLRDSKLYVKIFKVQ